MRSEVLTYFGRKVVWFITSYNYSDYEQQSRQPGKPAGQPAGQQEEAPGWSAGWPAVSKAHTKTAPRAIARDAVFC